MSKAIDKLSDALANGRTPQDARRLAASLVVASSPRELMPFAAGVMADRRWDAIEERQGWSKVTPADVRRVVRMHPECASYLLYLLGRVAAAVGAA